MLQRDDGSGLSSWCSRCSWRLPHPMSPRPPLTSSAAQWKAGELRPCAGVALPPAGPRDSFHQWEQELVHRCPGLWSWRDESGSQSPGCSGVLGGLRAGGLQG